MLRIVVRLLAEAPKDRSPDHLICAARDYPTLEEDRREVGAMPLTGATTNEELQAIERSIACSSGPRNVTIHAPFFVGQNTSTKEMIVGPHYFQNNKFARQLKKLENILVELEYYRMKADTINDYALRVHFALGHEDRPWLKKDSFCQLANRRSPVHSRVREESPNLFSPRLNHSGGDFSLMLGRASRSFQIEDRGNRYRGSYRPEASRQMTVMIDVLPFRSERTSPLVGFCPAGQV